MTGCSCGDCELCGQSRLRLCSLDYINGPRPTPEAMQEIHAFAYHLRDHAKGQPVEGCRFCAERERKRNV